MVMMNWEQVVDWSSRGGSGLEETGVGLDKEGSGTEFELQISSLISS